MDPKISPTYFKKKKKKKKKKKSRRREGAVLPRYIFLYCMCLCADEFTVKKIVCKEFAKVQFSHSFSLWYSRERERCQAFAKVLFSNSLKLSLYCTLRTMNVNYLLFF